VPFFVHHYDDVYRRGKPFVLWERSVSRETRRLKRKLCAGFTLVELLIIMAIIMTLSAIAVPNLVAALEYAKNARASADIHALGQDIFAYSITKDKFPNTLADIGADTRLDPWGNPYQYLNFANVNGNGKMRKDRFLVPINTDFDLYSLGKDGNSVSPLTAKASQDDIIWANDGSYVGLASEF
jgi:general secretion pathway protein G